MLDIIHAGGLVYAVVPDFTAEQVAIAILRLFDQDGVTPVDTVSVPGVSDPRFGVLTKDSGLIVVVADPVIALPNPAVPPSFSMSLTVPGFRSVTVPIVLPPNPVLPVMLPPIVLRRSPVTLSGRAVLASTGAPVADATIGFAPNPAIPGQVVIALGQALVADVPDATPLLGVSLTPVGGPVPVKTVQENAPAGATWLTLDDRQGLTAGQILRLGPAEWLSLARIGVVAQVPVDLTKPGIVLLSTPLTATARRSDPAQPCVAGPPAPSATIGQAFAGEALLLAAAVPAGDALIAGSVASGIPHTVTPATDADGYYLQSGIARLPRLDVTMSAAGLATQTITWEPAAGTTRIDWRMSP
jgi:hypothetical protein